MIDARVLAADVRALPALSSTVHEALRLLRVETNSAAAVEKVILRDAALTVNVLRAANSPIFGLHGHVRSVGHALMLLGRARVRDLVVTAGLQAALPEEFLGYQLTASGFMTHAMAVGYLSERIGQRCVKGREAPWFVAGLLHDIGKLILSRHLREHQQELLSQLEQRATLVSAERALFGMDHTQVGAVLGKSWQLPLDIIGAATGHHAPSAIGRADLTDVVHVANVTAHAMGYGADVAGLARSLDAGAFHRLGLNTSILERIASEALEALVEMRRSVTADDQLQ